MRQSRQNLQLTAYQSLKKRIMSAELTPGTKLNESILMEELGMGRTPIREALLELRGQGLITIYPQSGTYVAPINMKSAEDARFVRENIERKVAYEATLKCDDSFSENLEELVEIAKIKSKSHDPNAFFKFDNNFHKSFYLEANRPEVWNWLQEINAQLSRFRWLRLSADSLSWDTILSQHQQIVDAVKTKDANKVEKLVTDHLHLMLEEKQIVLKEFPEYFDFKK